MSAVAAALADFIQRYLAAHPEPTVEFDPEWPSPCEIGQAFTAEDGNRRIRWAPLERTYANDLAAVERALEMPVHDDIKAYYGSYWSAHLDARASEGDVSLLQVWNPQDSDRLAENMLGHYLVQKRARAPFTLFFACTEEDSDLILSLDNDSGAVLLERPGQKPLREVSPNLATFLAALEPAPGPVV